VRWPGRPERVRRAIRQKIYGSARVQNGHVLTDTVLSVTVSQGEVRRLAKLMARAEGAVMVANAATQAAQSAQQALQQAVMDACLEEGVKIPQDSNADIDWKTGEITITPPVPQVQTLGPQQQALVPGVQYVPPPDVTAIVPQP